MALALRLLAALWALTACALAQGAGDARYQWVVTKQAWTAADEAGFERYVTAIGESGCDTPEACLSWPANPLAKDAPPGLNFKADCADFVYLLRAYYAWKNGLPFGFASAVAPGPGSRGDARYTANGNVITERTDIATSIPDVRRFFGKIRAKVSTAMLRVDPRAEGKLAQDFYSPALNREAIRVGSIVYDPDGHVVMIYRIDPDGRLYYMDSHPDLMVTRGIFGAKLDQRQLALGSGFKSWRPVQVIDGRLVYAANGAIPGFAADQYAVKEAPGSYAFYAAMRERMAEPGFRFDVVREFDIELYDLCNTFQDRARFVNVALQNRMPRLARPARLEGVTGEERWTYFAHSTPVRDSRFRKQAAQVRASLSDLIARAQARDPRVTVSNRDLRGALEAIYAKRAKACTISYRNSQGATVQVNLSDAIKRITELSFDPYSCAERRWGAEGSELATCKDDEVKGRWYAAAKPLRLGPTSNPGGIGNPTLEELEAWAAGGSVLPLEVDIAGVIASAPSRGL
jgi:hypothetical protein